MKLQKLAILHTSDMYFRSGAVVCFFRRGAFTAAGLLVGWGLVCRFFFAGGLSMSNCSCFCFVSWVGGRDVRVC